MPRKPYPHDLPPWEAGCSEAMVSDLRSIIRVAQGRQGQSSAAVLD